jgi:hypothetical protein
MLSEELKALETETREAEKLTREDAFEWLDQSGPNVGMPPYSHRHVLAIIRLMRDGEAATAELDRLADRITKLEGAMRAWWLSKRPVAWGEKEHRDSPNVNLVTDTEKGLAAALEGDCEPTANLGKVSNSLVVEPKVEGE